MKTWNWVGERVVYMIHDRLMADQRGNSSVLLRDVVEGALKRPVELAEKGDPDICDLAACYAFWLARTLGFAQGKAATAWIVARLFIVDNGRDLEFGQVDAYRLMRSVADGETDRDAIAQWLRERLV